VTPEDLVPRPEHRFAFGLWTVGHPGRDPFGEVVRPALDPAETVRRLADLGAWGVSFHDDDLVRPEDPPSEQEAVVKRFRRALDDTGVVVSMATTNLFWHPVFKEGAFTANDPEVRRLALAKVMRGLDLGAEFGARTYVFWGGREGSESVAAKPVADALDRYKEALDFLCGYVVDRGYGVRFALEPKPNEPRGDTLLPTVGHMLVFIERLDRSEMVGVNPEVAHETMVGLPFSSAVAQALWAGKLFHVDLNAQKVGRYDQDLRFGSEGIQDAFATVALLEDGGYDGPRHFDARPYRVETGEGVWEFAAGCMRTYLALAARARELAADPELQGALADAGVPDLATPTVGPYSREAADRLLAEQHDLERLAARGYRNERLDQLVVDHLLGLR
jgi:xylose isomerase